MIDVYDVYKYYKKAESKYKNKPYKIKDMERVFNKLNDDNKETIQTLSDYFNTKWFNVNPELYFLAGFKTWKSFNWTMTLRPDVMKKYIANDKTRKRSKKYDIKESIEWIKEKYGSVKKYCDLKDGNVSQPIIDYMRSKMPGILVSYLINKKILTLTEQDNSYIMYLNNEN